MKEQWTYGVTTIKKSNNIIIADSSYIIMTVLRKYAVVKYNLVIVFGEAIERRNDRYDPWYVLASCESYIMKCYIIDDMLYCNKSYKSYNNKNNIIENRLYYSWK
jgi:hypothetical protein